ncbi:MAG TPA: ATP-binding protein [Bacteroidales bacterium]|nr:MAG: hypothetical protein A2X11_01200 [Bacteroidetes bacterium GWE2_42_24]OFY27315.1 MAG: hypothetical protein A2X09_00410 [Bacteroidetes bacterium GWF2_43_11]HAQ65062.1 ATP-binding protein [Bacteroidales bacterium]HBZ65939.1 ATP-binding protein [Bacteroidales bacterium]
MNLPSTLTLRSQLADQVLLESFVDEVCEYYNIGNTYFGHILLSLTEAFQNAVVHGNQNDSSKKVTISLHQTRRGLKFSVSDEGAGFEPDAIPDPTNPESEEDTSEGRGLFTIVSLADEVSYSNNGRIIHISFYVSSMNLELSEKRASALVNYFKPINIKSDKES